MKAWELTCGGRFGIESHMVRMSVILLLFMTCSALGLDAKAQCDPEEIFKLLASDGAASDNFGCRVAVSGTVGIVGAYRHSVVGTHSGAAYIFDTTTGTQIAKLLPNDGAAYDYFGMSVAIDGTTAIIGAPYDDDNGTDSGAAYLFDITTGTQLAKLLPADGTAQSMFGMSVETSGTNTIIGSPYDDVGGTNSGSAYLFDTTTGTQVAKLLPADGGAENEVFGISVTIDSDTALVGALDDDNGVRSGSAFFFDISTGDQLAKIYPADAVTEQYFGFSLAIDSAVAIIGAKYDNALGFASGAAYIFDTCSVTSQTIDAAYHCQPAAGIVPFTTRMAVVMENLFTTQSRRFACRINITLADGSYYGNWREGYSNMAEGGRRLTTWYQPIQAIGSVIGSNLFELVAEDVTPAPWNQPPYPPSGDTATAACTVTGVAP